MASLAQAAVLPTDFEPETGASFQPVDSEERALWQRLERIEEVIRSSPQRLVAPELEDYMREVVERLIGRPAPELRIYLMRDASLNAAMLPSGMMIVNTGLLVRVRDEAQLAAVLGHEVGHYFRKHSLTLYRDTRRKASLTSASASALNSYNESFGAWNMINHAILLSGFRFSRDLESEADAYGLMLMARAGYPPRAASAIWGQVVDERRASAAARQKRYRDGTSSALSTHPPTDKRMTDLADTAAYLARKEELQIGEDAEEWSATMRPYLGMLLQEQVYLNDPGASLYLLENLARDDWDGLLRFNEGEVYRLRDADGDDLKAAAAYAAATALEDAPPEAWRAHGFALLKADKKSDAHEALNQYLEMKPDATDGAMIRFMMGQVHTGANSAPGRDLVARMDSPWKRLPSGTNQSRWEEVWTWNGPQLDRTALVGGLPDGKAIISQEPNADQRVPVFRADMTSQDLASMIEVSYRVNGVAVFDVESVEPVDFLGGAGIRMRYSYVSGIGIAKRGSCVMRAIDGKLYAMRLESVAGRYFDAVSPAFDLLINSAQLRE
jgi:beta-barrel assembly-enhancing protease